MVGPQQEPTLWTPGLSSAHAESHSWSLSRVRADIWANKPGRYEQDELKVGWGKGKVYRKELIQQAWDCYVRKTCLKGWPLTGIWEVG